ncbi:hypothetical protein C0995_007597 [Termitomyces sp. Mi166|nr:hypothetical protein C0995_007597 [Termitomyces sp. Mi166\
MDCHSSTMFYTSSEAGLATNGATWVASRFGSISTTLGTLNIGTTVTYPQFVVTPDNLLQFVYRTGVSGNGATQLSEYNGGVWSNVGSWASGSGTYTSTNGVTSSARNLYIHGFTYRFNRLHVTGTWREQVGGVSCSSGGLTNHDTTYFYSDDKGRTWHNSAGASVGTSGSNPMNVNTAGIIVDPLNADHGLMNQESQTVDSSGQIHTIISYVPGRFTQCVTNYEADRIAHGFAFHLYRSSNGTFTKFEIPFPINAVGRSQIVLDSADNAYVVLPFVRIVTASKSSGWTDWTLVYDGAAAGLNAFGEVTVDRARLISGVLSVLYQVRSTGTTPSAILWEKKIRYTNTLFRDKSIPAFEPQNTSFPISDMTQTQRYTTANPYEAQFGYSRAVRRGPFIFVSGTTSVDPTTGVVQHPGSAHEQALKIFYEIIRAIEALGGTRQDVMRIRMFVTADEDTNDVGRALKENFGDVGPAATMIVGAEFVRAEMKVEIEADAVVLWYELQYIKDLLSTLTSFRPNLNVVTRDKYYGDDCKVQTK